MKKILLAAFAASLLAAGCQKTEVYQPANSGEKMTFSTEMKKITKAGEDGTTTSKNEGTQTLESQGFYLWAYAAYSTENITNVNTTTRIFDGIQGMQLNYSDGKWNTPQGKVYYWPGQNKNLRFFAISGIDDTNESILKDANLITHGISENENHVINKVKPTMEIADFVVDGTDDLMVADFIEQNQSQNDRKVVLNFHHALSKVEFFFKAKMPDATSNLKVYVQKLKVLDVANTGTLKVSTAEEFADGKYQATVRPSWGESQDGEQDFEMVSNTNDNNISNLVKVGTEAEYTIEKDSKTLATLIDPTSTAATPLSFAKWLMLPQTITGKLVEIIYIIGDRQFKAVFPLDASTAADNTTKLTSWGINQYIKYTVNLSPNMISFDAKVETDWEVQSGLDHIN